jgi:hypothetical protein
VSESLVISALSLIFVMLSALLGVLIKVVMKWTRTEDRLADLTDDVKRLNESTDRRITWLEQNLWARKR